MSDEGRATIRVDKFLWQARFFKTRPLAQTLVQKGRVRVNGQKISKPGRSVSPGDTLTFPMGTDVRVITILDLPLRRGPATEARALYRDHDADHDGGDDGRDDGGDGHDDRT